MFLVWMYVLWNTRIKNKKKPRSYVALQFYDFKGAIYKFVATTSRTKAFYTKSSLSPGEHPAKGRCWQERRGNNKMRGRKKKDSLESDGRMDLLPGCTRRVPEKKKKKKRWGGAIHATRKVQEKGGVEMRRRREDSSQRGWGVAPCSVSQKDKLRRLVWT